MAESDNDEASLKTISRTIQQQIEKSCRESCHKVVDQHYKKAKDELCAAVDASMKRGTEIMAGVSNGVTQANAQGLCQDVHDGDRLVARLVQDLVSHVQKTYGGIINVPSVPLVNEIIDISSDTDEADTDVEGHGQGGPANRDAEASSGIVTTRNAPRVSAPQPQSC